MFSIDKLYGKKSVDSARIQKLSVFIHMMMELCFCLECGWWKEDDVIDICSAKEMDPLNVIKFW